MMQKKNINIIIAEDHTMLREKYIEILAPHDIIAIGQASNGEQALQLLETLKPDVILLDLNMPVMNGSEALTEILKHYPRSKVIILSHHNSDLLINDYINRGAKSYLPKDMSDVDTLVDVINRVYAGETVFFRSEKGTAVADPDLSDRQLEIVPLICDGLTNKEIAKKIKLTERAVEKQRQKLYQKTKTHNLVSFLAYAIREGFHFLGKPIAKAQNSKQLNSSGRKI